MGSLVWSVLSLVAKISSRSTANKLANAIWKRLTGRNPPSSPLAPSTSWGEATAWAIVTGSISSLAIMVATRQAARFYQVSAGHLPKKLRDAGRPVATGR